MDARLLWWEHGNFVFQAPRDGSSAPVNIGSVDGGAANRFSDDATHIYWLSRDRIVRAPKAGGASEEWLLPEPFAFGAWAMDEATVYLTNAFATALYKMPRGGGALETVAASINTAGDGGGAVRLTLAGAFAYVGYLGDMFRVELASGTVSRIATGLAQVSNAVVLGDAVYWLDGRTMQGADIYVLHPGEERKLLAHTDTATLTGSLVGDATRQKLYFFPTTFSALTCFDIATSRFTSVTASEWSTRYLVADDDFLYWTRNDMAAPAVMRMRKP